METLHIYKESVAVILCSWWRHVSWCIEQKYMFRKMLFRKEIMCAARFSTSGVAHLRMTERNTNKRDLTILWGRCLQGVWQKRWHPTCPIYCSLSGWITPAISRWTGWHTHRSTTESRDKVSFSSSQGVRCILMIQSGISRNVRYMEQMVLQSEDNLLFCWSPKKW